MPKSDKSSQQRQRGASRAKVVKVSKPAMAKKIIALNQKYNLSYDVISQAMGRSSGYAHLIIDGSRCKPTESDASGLNGMWVAVTEGAIRTKNDTDTALEINGLLAKAMRLNSER
jgi:hypothetical protein